MKRWKPKGEEKVWYLYLPTNNSKIQIWCCYAKFIPDFYKSKFPLGYYKTKREAQAMIKQINKLVWGK